MTDAIVVAGTGEGRSVLTIQRSDNGKFALPGGHVDEGESALNASLRELAEETGVQPADSEPIPMQKRIVDDHRNTDHCWAVSAPFLILLEEQIPAAPADDATDTVYLPFGSMQALEAALADRDADLFEAHRPLLEMTLQYLEG